MKQRGIYIGEHRCLWPIAAEYLPEDKDAPILCVGPGRGWFEREHLMDRPNVVLVEASDEHGAAAMKWAPKTWRLMWCDVQRMSYANKVDRHHFTMCSHVLEHLEPMQVHYAMRVLDSETEVGGILVLAGPLAWPHFWADLTHVRPYHPEVFVRYLCGCDDDHSLPCVSRSYTVEELVYSWSCDGPEDKLDTWKDFPIKRFCSPIEPGVDMMGPAREPVYRRNSWLLVMRKGA